MCASNCPTATFPVGCGDWEKEGGDGGDGGDDGDEEMTEMTEMVDMRRKGVKTEKADTSLRILLARRVVRREMSGGCGAERARCHH